MSTPRRSRTLEEVADLLDTALVIRRLIWSKRATVWQVKLERIAIRPDDSENKHKKWATIKAENVNTALVRLAQKVSFAIVRKGGHLPKWKSTDGVWLGEVVVGSLYVRTDGT